MGKKVKIGKFRKDKFYQLAKEAGYRSRAAFKLLQLNRTYHFLEKSRICVDLCAAPGGWCQVAASHMPMSSVIIGIDLAPIKPIANVITHVEDITSDKCRQLIKRDLNDNKADVFLHDGAPNVGKNWLHDAYQQNMLVLQSFKLATEFLKKGGWFITKVFRSKDYYSIMWVFQQFFKKVESTKPQASRSESAEIFVVCQAYKAPEKIDPKFFDIKFVFSEVESAADTNKAVDLFKPPKRNRGGYPDGDMTLYHVLKASEFIESENFIELLGKSNCIELDDEKIANHASTTNEIKELVKDLKILGKTDLKNLLKWRLKVKSDIDEKPGDINEAMKKKPDEKKNGEENEDEAIENQIKEALYNEKKLDKKKKKREDKEKKKLKEKLSLNMVYKDDILDHKSQGDNDIFSLNKIKTKKQLLELQSAVPGLVFSDNEEENDELKLNFNKKKKVAFLKDDRRDDEDDDVDEDDDDEEMEFNESDDEENQGSGDESDEDEDNPLLTDLSQNGKKTGKDNLWFNKDSFEFMNDPDEENQELLGVLEDGEEEHKKKVDKSMDDKENLDRFDDDEEGGKLSAVEDKTGTKKNARKLSALELALGETMVNSKKARRDLVDATYNRYSTFEDENNLPQWFVEDEEKNYRRDVTVPRQVLSDYKKKFEDINARPIKKVVEAQARKKRRMSKKLDRVRKKAETISDNADMTDKERSRELKQVYKKAGLIGKKKAEVKYVVAKKGVRGRVAAKGIKGPYKVVDRRLKKDRVSMRRAANKGSKGKGNGKGNGKGKGKGGKPPMQRGRKIQGGRPKS